MSTQMHTPSLVALLLVWSSPLIANMEFSANTHIITNEAGDIHAKGPPITFKKDNTLEATITIKPLETKQTISGIGTSFTESSAFVLAHLEPSKRAQVMKKIFSESGANFSLMRTTIGSTDFSVKGKYSYADTPNAQLHNFSIAVDKDGFSTEEYPNIEDTSYDILPMIKEALSIKQLSNDSTMNIIASAWTAPYWMKDINTWFIQSTEANNYQGTGGSLLPEYVDTYAQYLLKYLQAYKQEGVSIWGLTPVNEPNGNSGMWESMHFTPETQNHFIKNHLGPKLTQSNMGVNLLIYDQNRDHLMEWATTILGDEETNPYVYGTAVHWYSSTYKVYEKELRKIHELFPDKVIINTEATIDNLGVPAGGGILDPKGYEESGWFQNDTFWWNDNATDWAYTAQWAPNAAEHPKYTPVHRYARDIIVGLDNWMTGWVDWNVVLDKQGGPNHVGNYCGAPIMIDIATKEIYYTPIFHILSQFSRTIRPGDSVITQHLTLPESLVDKVYSLSTINDSEQVTMQLLNTTRASQQISVRMGEYVTNLTLTPNALHTIWFDISNII